MIERLKQQIEKLSIVNFHSEYKHGFNTALECIRNMIELEKEEDFVKYDYDRLKERISSLGSEYKAYHTKSSYWRGIKYALDMLGWSEHEKK